MSVLGKAIFECLKNGSYTLSKKEMSEVQSEFTQSTVPKLEEIRQQQRTDSAKSLNFVVD